MIGLFGGTFDPVHFGHLRPALEVYQALGLHQLRLIPLNQAVHRAQPVAAPRLRLRMLRAAADDQPGFVVDDREIERAGASRTLDTLLSLRAEFGPERPFCLLIGADAFEHFHCWYRPTEILELAHLVVMRRPDARLTLPEELQPLLDAHQVADMALLRERPGGAIWFQEVTQLAISATAIRTAIRQGISARFLLPDPVLEMINQTGVYRDP